MSEDSKWPERRERRTLGEMQKKERVIIFGGITRVTNFEVRLFLSVLTKRLYQILKYKSRSCYGRL